MKKTKKMRKVFSFLFVSLFFGVCTILIHSLNSAQNNNKTKISVILPVYNVENYLKECLDSVINQSYKNLEIICVNDGSTDNSLEILKKYETKDSRVKLIDQENQGVSAARNQGIKHATGDYIAFVDPDDILERNAYEITLKKMKKDVDIIIFGYTAFPNATGWWKHAGDNIDKIYTNDSINAYFDCHISHIVWNKLYKKSIIDENNIEFDTNLKMAEDVDFNLQIFVHTKKVQLIENKFYNYRLKRKNSLTDIYVGKSKSENHEILYENVLKNWSRLNLLDKNNSTRVFTYFVNITYNTLNEMSKHSDKQIHARNFMKLIRDYMSQEKIEQFELTERIITRYKYIKELVQ